MNLSDYRLLPDYMDLSEVEKYCYLILEESSLETASVTIDKLREMANRQWHTYQTPSLELQMTLKQWLIQHWIGNSEDYLEFIMIIAFNFCLDKDLFAKALSLYTGRHTSEFQQDYDKSKGNSIDPWWSMKQENDGN